MKLLQAYYLAEQILRILSDPNIDPQKVCHGIPTDITKSSTYVVDLASLKHPDDIKKDFFGVWSYNGSLLIPMYIKMDMWN